MDAEVSELGFIKRCRDLDFSIPDVVVLRDLADAPSNSCQIVRRLGRKHLADVRAKLNKLNQLEKALAELVSNCANVKSGCPMLDALRAR